ncbi:MAG: glycosyltransferase family 4 protein [Verrucomicrobiae bacterium]|nr:glycosyltransferase family 4 protein [Verrucomicrobiae bacterium]
MPLGGGKAVADYLCRELPSWQVLSPRTVGLMDADPQRSLALHEWNEWRYARFCREFERAITNTIMKYEPTGCVVVSNDISEGPDFDVLGRRGYRLVSIWHVDVVEYFTKFYLRGLVQPQTAARWSRYRWLPDVLRLVFHKQADCVRWSRRLVVPSEPMRAVIERCYGAEAAGKVVVVPWGNITAPCEATLQVNPCPDDGVVTIITLSRLSPEKGIDRLLRALRYVRADRYRVWICGAPAYMRGRRYERKLRRMAAGLPVEFLGHVTGEQKAAILYRADVFVSPSRHESYGLTIAEAEAAGCRVISSCHYGARGRVVNCDDALALARALDEEISQGRQVKTFCPAASDAAARLAAIVETVAQE